MTLRNVLLALALIVPGLGHLASAGNSIPPPEVAPGKEGAPFTPIVSQLVTSPTAFKGDDGRRHLAFELMLTNSSPRAATVTDVMVTSGCPAYAVNSEDEAKHAFPICYLPPIELQHLNGESEVAGSMTQIGSLTVTPTASIPTYTTNQLLLDAVVPPGASVPTSLVVTLKATFQEPLPGQPPYVSIYPDAVTQVLPAVTVATTRAIVIPSPLAGGDWVAMNSCCKLSAHRAAMLGGGGKMGFPERHAIDFIRIDSNGGLYRPGEPPSMANNYSYGAELLAVAPGKIVAIQNGIPDQPPDVNPTGYSLNQLGGDYVVLEINPHLYALYAHISPDTIRVKLGQRVVRGQVLGLLGNSGNSTAPHLHFQLINGPAPLTSDGVPYVFEQLTLVGRPDGDVFVPVNPAVEQTHAYPLTYSVVVFPGASSANINPGAPLPGTGFGPGN
jgi:hypothetical protein